MDEPVQDGVGQSRIADDLVPTVDRHLAGDHDGAGVVAIFDDLQQVEALLVERFFACINRNRRLAKDFEATIASAEAFLTPPRSAAYAAAGPISMSFEPDFKQLNDRLNLQRSGPRLEAVKNPISTRSAHTKLRLSEGVENLLR